MNKTQYNFDDSLDADLMRYFDYEVSDNNSITACNKRGKSVKRKDDDDKTDVTAGAIVNFLILSSAIGIFCTLCYFLSEIGV